MNEPYDDPHYSWDHTGKGVHCRLDEDGYMILVSLWHLYRFSNMQDCWIAARPELVTEFKDLPGEAVSVEYVKANGYWNKHDVFSDKEACEEYRHRQEVRKLEARWTP